MAGHVILVTLFLALNFTQLAGLVILSSSSESGRVLAESGNVSEASIRLDNNTVRVDPLNNYKKYRGGYDVRNKHYWSSTAFTGIGGYSIAVIWLLCGLGYGVLLLVTTYCCKTNRKLKKRSVCQKQCYMQPLILSIFLTILAVTACGLAFGGNSKFYHRVRTIINIIIDAANESSDTIYNTTGALKDMRSSLTEVEGSSKATDFLTSTSDRLDTQAAQIETEASKNKSLIDKGLKKMYAITTMMIALTLIIVIALLAFRVLKFQRTLQVLIIVCWIFTVLCWLFFGIYFFLQNFAKDTCTALEGFQQNPYNNSFSPILPCEELLSAKPVLTEVSAGIYNLVNKVNQDIVTSYGNIIQICNPFSSPPMYEYQPWNCSDTSIRIGDIPRVMRMLACPDLRGETCNGGILVPTSYYKTVEAYSTSIQTLLDAYPGMERLIQCQTVKDAFSKILHKQCKPLKRHLRLVWAALVFLSVVLVALLLIWIIGAHHERNHHSFVGSVNPHCADTIECRIIKPDNDDPEPGPQR